MKAFPDPVDFETRILLNNLLELVNSPAKILDVGCGSGIIAKYIADGGYDVLGIDVSILPYAAPGKLLGGIIPPLTPFRAYNVSSIQNGGTLNLMAVNAFDFVPSNSFDGAVMFSLFNYFNGNEHVATFFTLLSAWLLPGSYIAASWINDDIPISRQVEVGCLPSYDVVANAAGKAGFILNKYWEKNIRHTHGNDQLDETLGAVEHEHNFSFGLWQKLPA